MNSFLWKNIFRTPRNECDIIAELWKQTPLFKGIPMRHVRALAENMHVRRYLKDELVFHQGDQGAGAVLVLEGQVRVMADDTLLAELERGDFFGEITLAETDKRTADACCTRDSRLVYFLKQDVEEWIEVEPRLGTVFLMNLASILAQRLHLANQLIAQKC